jgi:hypothetical protein
MDQTPSDPPTFYGNIATVHVNVDEVSIEVRRILIPHGTLWRQSQGKEPATVWSDDEVYKYPPIAKIVLTFLAAKQLRETLNTMFPSIEEQRKA